MNYLRLIFVILFITPYINKSVCIDISNETAKELLKEIKNASDYELKQMNSTLPNGWNSLINNFANHSSYDVQETNSNNITNVLSIWVKKEQWPEDISKKFLNIIDEKGLVFQTFDNSFASNKGHLCALIGSGRNDNDNITIAYVSSCSQGLLITQYYGEGKTIMCGSFTYQSYDTSPGCMATPMGCGGTTCTSCPSGKTCFSCGVLPCTSSCVTCSCTIIRPSIPIAHVITGSFDCLTIRTAQTLMIPYQIVNNPTTCSLLYGNVCSSTTPISTTQYVDFTPCKKRINECIRPYTEEEESIINRVLIAIAKPNIPIAVDLLAVKLKQPQPYPKLIDNILSLLK